MSVFQYVYFVGLLASCGRQAAPSWFDSLNALCRICKVFRHGRQQATMVSVQQSNDAARDSSSQLVSCSACKASPPRNLSPLRPGCLVSCLGYIWGTSGSAPQQSAKLGLLEARGA